MDFRQHRKMVGTEVAEPLQSSEHVVFINKDVVEGPAEEKVSGVKRVQHSSAYARIARVAQALELPGCVRPGDVVEISRYDRRFAILCNGPADDHNFGVTFVRISSRLGRARMNAVEIDPNSRAESHSCVDR